MDRTYFVSLTVNGRVKTFLVLAHSREDAECLAVQDVLNQMTFTFTSEQLVHKVNQVSQPYPAIIVNYSGYATIYQK